MRSAGTPGFSTGPHGRSTRNTWNGSPQRELTTNPLSGKLGADQAAEYLPAELHGDFEKVLAEEPRPVPDQQLNGRLQAQQAFRPHPQRGDKVFEARSVPGLPSTRPWPAPASRQRRSRPAVLARTLTPEGSSSPPGPRSPTGC